jgi:serine/threonine protein kinase
MNVAIGARVGNYEIVGLLGVGGMGEVYRARDHRLARDVAIKILAPSIAADHDAVLRFEREARSLAALNHPNIAAIYDVLESGGRGALVLELIEGGTLADQVARKALSIADATNYARQIADALDTAHEAGIVHRDLKPSNIAITSDGRVKVLDFGLAKAIAAAASQRLDAGPATTLHNTSHGVILGTAAYMSPEQARGKPIDKRTDIWAFGCILYEMLTAQRAFDGETSSDVIAAIIEREPRWASLPTGVSRPLRRVIARCLDKDARRRARDIADVLAELDADETAPPAPSRRPSVAIAALSVAAIAALGVGATAVLWRPAAESPNQPIEFSFAPPEGYSMATQPGGPSPSPDGREIAFVARDDRQVASVWIRPIDSSTSRRLEGTEGVTPGGVGWSPDSRELAFFVSGSWKRINIDGGPAVTIALNGSANLGISWGPADTLLVAPANRTALTRVAGGGGAFQPVTTLDAETENSHRWPQWLPDGRHFLFTARSDSPERLGIKLGSIESTDVKPLVHTASQGVFTEPGLLLFMTPDNVLMAQRLDPSTWTLTGTARPIAGAVRYNGGSFFGSFGASLDGRVLAYMPAARGASTLEWFDRSGKSLGRVGPEGPYVGLRLSPNGGTVAVEIADARYGTRDIWSVDAATQALTRLTSNAATDWRPVFSPDGSSIVFASDRAGRSTLFRTSVGGASGEVPLYRSDVDGVFPADWSRDGTRLLVLVDGAPGRPQQLLMVAADGSSATTLIEPRVGGVQAPRFSPEGDRVAFASSETGRSEIYVVSIKDRQRVRVSADGGTNPTWGRDGREVFFQSPRNEIMRAQLGGPEMATAAKPEVLFRPCATVQRSFTAGPAEQTYDVADDGTRFLIKCDALDVAAPGVTVVVNWQGRLR